MTKLIRTHGKDLNGRKMLVEEFSAKYPECYECKEMIYGRKVPKNKREDWMSNDPYYIFIDILWNENGEIDHLECPCCNDNMSWSVELITK